MQTREVKVGNVIIGGGHPIVVQSMCNTRTSDIDASVAQCKRLYEAGAGLIRLTVPTPDDVRALAAIRERLRECGIDTPLVADVHFSSEIAIAAAETVENRITTLYGNTSLAMKEAAMEWLGLCEENDFHDVVVSLKASNTIVMVEAYRLLARAMEERGMAYPLHLGVTEAGNGDSGRIKSAAGISALLSEGIGDTIRVSLTEDPVNEIPVAQYLADRYGHRLHSSMVSLNIEGGKATAVYEAPSRERFMLDMACDFGKMLLDRKIDDVEFRGSYRAADGSEIRLDGSEEAAYFSDELLQAARRRFYKPEYVACPGCGRTMYNLEETFNEVKRRTSHLKGMVIAVMGCIVNGPGEMADADWGYVGEGGHKVTIYRKKTPVLKHIPENEAIDRLLELIEGN